MSLIPRLRIGAKLAISAGIGVALVAAMLANEQIGNASMTGSSGLVVINHANKANALSAAAAMQRSQAALRDIYLARSDAEIDTAVETLRQSAGEAAANADAAAKRATQEARRTLYRKLKASIESYLAVATELAAMQKFAIASLARQERDAGAFAATFDP